MKLADEDQYRDLVSKVFGSSILGEGYISVSEYIGKLSKVNKAQLIKISHLLFFYHDSLVLPDPKRQGLSDLRLIVIISAVEAIIGTNIDQGSGRVKEFYFENTTQNEKDYISKSATFYPNTIIKTITNPENLFKQKFGSNFTRVINWVIDNRNDFLHRSELIRLNKKGFSSSFVHTTKKGNASGYADIKLTVDQLSTVTKNAIIRYLADRRKIPKQDLRYRSRSKGGK